MYTQRNVGYLHIGADVTGWSDKATHPQDLLTGEIGIFKPDGTEMTEALAATENDFVIYTRQADGKLVVSPVINKNHITKCIKTDYAAATAQVDFIGYNGTTGSIEAINDNLYKVHIYVQELLRSNSDGRKVKHGSYLSDSSATQAEVAIGLAGNLVNNFVREDEKFMTFKAICNVAASATNDMTNAVTATNGSKVLSVATALTYNGTSGTLVVGDYIRFAPSTAATDLTTDDATTRAYEVYEVKEISGLFVTLDRPFTGVSELYEDADDACQVIPAATGAAADWGVVMTGATLSADPGKFNYSVTLWDTQLVDFGTTTENFKSTAASKGTNHPTQIAEMEWFFQGNEGEYHREGFKFLFSPRANAVASPTGGGYDVIAITVDASHVTSFSNNVSPYVVYLCVPSTATSANYALAATGDDFTDVLEVLAFGAAGGELALV